MQTLKYEDLFKVPHRRIAEIADPHDRRLLAALRASEIGVFEYEPQTDTAFWDDRVRELWGLSDIDDITYEIVIAQVHPEDRALHDQETERALNPNGDGHMDMTYRVLPKDGHPMRWIKATAHCFFREGKPVRLVGTVTDVTEQLSALEHNQLLVRELAHRVKNVIATAVAIVKLSRTGAKDLESYGAAVDERLRALSISQDVIRKSDWLPVEFATLLAATARSFLGDGWIGDRIVMDCSAYEIPADDVMAFSMALHELLTNSAKYGALSSDAGRVHIGVSVSQGETRVEWAERDGPPTEPSETIGFGSMLLTEILPAQLRGKAELRLEGDGLRYALRIPTP